MLKYYNRLLALAAQALENGEEWQARDFFSQAQSLSFKVGTRAEQAFILDKIAELDFRRGRIETAHIGASAAADIYREMGPPDALAEALRLSARALDRMGWTDMARARWTEAREHFAAASRAKDVADCDRRLGN